MSQKRKLVVGTRRSTLAMWQTEWVVQALCAKIPALEIEIRQIITRGDTTQASGEPLPQIGGKGLFTAELEAELSAGRIDFAVHSLKDLPTTLPAQFTLGALPPRGSPWDVLVSTEGRRLADLPVGSIIGTSSVRRSSQIKRMRPDLVTASIRGNVDTRIGKLTDPRLDYSAIVLAAAGIERLGRASAVTQTFTSAEMLPSPGQGIMGVECRADDVELLAILSTLDDSTTRAQAVVERTFLAGLDAGCHTPVASYCRAEGDTLYFEGRCLSPSGERSIELSSESPIEDAEGLGSRMAEEARRQGFDELIRE